MLVVAYMLHFEIAIEIEIHPTSNLPFIFVTFFCSIFTFADKKVALNTICVTVVMQNFNTDEVRQWSFQHSLTLTLTVRQHYQIKHSAAAAVIRTVTKAIPDKFGCVPKH
jgi:hypothetical protein